MKNWKTTMCGLVTIACGIALISTGINAPIGASLIPVGAGFLMAKDHDTTGNGKNATKKCK